MGASFRGTVLVLDQDHPRVPGARPSRGIPIRPTGPAHKAWVGQEGHGSVQILGPSVVAVVVQAFSGQ